MAKYKEKDGESYSQNGSGAERSLPILHQRAGEIRPYGKIAKLPIALDARCARAAWAI